MYSLKDVIRSENPSLAVIRKEFGEGGDLVLRAMLNVFIIDVVTFFNVGKQMNPAQVAITSQLLAEKFYFLKPDDFKLCFNNAKAGYYNQLFDRIDGNILCTWLNEYCNERAEFYETQNINQHKEKIREEKNSKVDLAPEVRQEWTKLRENLEADVNREKEYQQFKKNYEEKANNTGAEEPTQEGN